MILMSVGYDHGVELAAGTLRNVFGDVDHAGLRCILRKARRSEINEHMSLRFRSVLKAQ
jgi:hypothetical protein